MIRWKDFDKPFGHIPRAFKPVFNQLLPELGRRSFDYHFTVYLDRFKNNLKDTIEEEKERFRNYLIFTYKLPDN